MDQTNSLLQSITGHPVRCLRPPYGYTDAAVVAQLGQRGLAELYWDVDPSDYLISGTSVIAARLLSALHPGAIVIMHDGGGDRSQTVSALPAIISGIRAAGIPDRARAKAELGSHATIAITTKDGIPAHDNARQLALAGRHGNTRCPSPRLRPDCWPAAASRESIGNLAVHGPPAAEESAGSASSPSSRWHG